MTTATEKQDRPFSFNTLIGESKPILDLIEKLKAISGFDASVLIEGESGTGKELVAKAIHFNSARKEKEFVIINCSAFSDSLLESELFGHLRGSFTGAVFDKKGLFEVADEGTFFLDEISDMSPALQVKLLRVLQEGTFFKIGATRPTQVNVRIVAATNRRLEELVAKGRFREDLYYRVNVVHLLLPPLRDRREDIPLLAQNILERLSRKGNTPVKKISQSLMKKFLDYSWPGNIRQLENELEKAVIFSKSDEIGEEAVSAGVLGGKQETSLNLMSSLDSLIFSEESLYLKEIKRRIAGEVDRKVIAEGLKRTLGNKSACARLLKISRGDLMRKLNRYRENLKGP